MGAGLLVFTNQVQRLFCAQKGRCRLEVRNERRKRTAERKISARGRTEAPAQGAGCKATAIGRADILQNVFGRLLLLLDIAALGDGHKAVLDLTTHAAGGIRQQRRKFILEIVLSIRLTDEVQHG